METPPLARGRLLPPADDAADLGNTPARAGKTISISIMVTTSRKHPRSRGEDFSRQRSVTAPEETPPLARGRRIRREHRVMSRRNTPARAGKTRWSGSAQASRWKHPRSRGEDLSIFGLTTPEKETPPLARGRPMSVNATHDCLGNTPARAGKTDARRSCRFPPGKHPRSRGEDWPRRQYRLRYPETPPLARGRLRQYRSDTRADGNTPARAGKTSGQSDLSIGSEKHPRSRGEDRPAHRSRR